MAFYFKKMSEIFKKIDGFSMYEVSNLGNIMCFSRKKPLLKRPSLTNSGYYSVTLTSDDGKLKTFSIHRLVAIAFVDNPSNLPVVNHINGIKTDNTCVNLEWTTHSGNHQHAVEFGLKSELNRRKLSEDDISNVIDMRRSGRTAKEISQKLNVPFYAVKDLCAGRTWAGSGISAGDFKNAGDRHSNSILKSADISIIRKMRNDGCKITDIAKKFGASKNTISDILHGRTWRGVVG